MSRKDRSEEPVESFTEIAPFYDQIMASVPYRFWLSYIEALWTTHGCRADRVLDVACGTGTVALLLAAKGKSVAGIDRSAAMIDVALRKAEEQNSDASFLVADASTMKPLRPPFDAAICLFDSLNNIVDPEALRAAIRNIRACLTGNGLFIFDMNTAYAFRQGMFNQRSSSLDAPVRYVWRSKFDPSTHICTVTMDFQIDARGSQPERRFTEQHVQRAYSRVEVEDMLTDAGFSEIQAYDAYTLFAPRKRSDRIFWVAR